MTVQKVLTTMIGMMSKQNEEKQLFQTKKTIDTTSFLLTDNTETEQKDIIKILEAKHLMRKQYLLQKVLSAKNVDGKNEEWYKALQERAVDNRFSAQIVAEKKMSYQIEKVEKKDMTDKGR